MADLYIGRAVSPAAMKTPLEDVRLDTRDLTRHAVCVGMTGSGKTGLCIALLEELATAGVPVVVIDPKGDMGNLALALGGRPGSDFLPWIDPGEAEREGMSPEAYADQIAARWRSGLTDWGMDDAAVQAYADRAQVTVYTPGSTAGVSVNVLGCLDRPAPELLEDPEGLAEHASGVVGALLGLVGEEADPIGDPATVTLTQLLMERWSAQQPCDLRSLLPMVVDPPFERVGVFPLDSFWPRKERMALAMRLNGLAASPAFATWAQGARLDPAALLSTAGRTPVSVFSLAHLDDAQRMFFATTLLGALVSWSRRQSGTSSLRALVYFDEVFGYLPPYPKDPPTKRPLLTLMKQARAVGVGTMLVTQNPVDIDYKALSNAGTWLIGRLQTRQDRERVLDGMGDADPQTAAWLEDLPGRTFLLRRAGAPPALVRSRQVICYLRGPLTLREVGQLGQASPAVVAAPQASPAVAPRMGPPSPPPSPRVGPPPPPPITRPAPPPPATGAAASSLLAVPPPAPAGFPFRFLDPAVVFSSRLAPAFAAHARAPRVDGAIEWMPAVLARLRLRFDEGRDWVVDRDELRLIFPLTGASASVEPELQPSDMLGATPSGWFESLPTSLDEVSELDALRRRVVDEVLEGETERMYRCAPLKLQSRAGEAEADFRARCAVEAESRAAEAGRKLAEKVRVQIDRIESKIRTKERALDAGKSDARARQATELLGAAETVFSWFSGRRRSVSAAMSRRSTTLRAGERVGRLEDELGDLKAEVVELDERTGEELQRLRDEQLALADQVDSVEVRLERTDLRVDDFSVLWVPVTRAV